MYNWILIYNSDVSNKDLNGFRYSLQRPLVGYTVINSYKTSNTMFKTKANKAK